MQTFFQPAARTTLCIVRLLVPFALVFGQATAHADDADLNGVWTGWQCPSGVRQDFNQCSNFTLELHQQNGVLCGAHLFASAGANRMDEGAAPSVTGAVTDGVATAFVTSGRSPVRLKAELRLAKGALQWQRLENPQGDYLLPLHARLTRSKSQSMFAPVFAQELASACTVMFNAAKAAQLPAPASAAGMPAASAPAR